MGKAYHVRLRKHAKLLRSTFNDEAVQDVEEAASIHPKGAQARMICKHKTCHNMYPAHHGNLVKGVKQFFLSV